MLGEWQERWATQALSADLFEVVSALTAAIKEARWQ